MEDRDEPATRPIKPLKRGRRVSQTPPIMAHDPPPGSQNGAPGQLHEHAPRVEAAEQSAFASSMRNAAEQYIYASRMGDSAGAAEKPAFAPSMRSAGAAEQSAFTSRMGNSAGAAEQSAFTSRMGNSAGAAEKPAFPPSMRSARAAEKPAFPPSMRSARAAEKSAFAPSTMRYNVTDEASKQRHASAAAPGPSPPGPGGSSPPLVRRRDPSEYMSETEPGRVPRLYDYPPDLEARINAQHDSIDFEHFTSTMNAIVDKQERVLEGVKNILQTPVPHIKSHFLQSDEEKERIQAGRRALLEQREEEGAKQDELMRKFKALMMVPPPILKARQAASSNSAPSPSEPSGLHRAQSEDDSDASINRGTAEEARLIEESRAEAEERESAARKEDEEMLFEETPHKSIESLQTQLEAATKKIAELEEHNKAITQSLFEERAKVSECRSVYECELSQVRKQRDKLYEDRRRFKKIVAEYVRSDDEASVWENASDAKDKEEDDVVNEPQVDLEKT